MAHRVGVRTLCALLFALCAICLLPAGLSAATVNIETNELAWDWSQGTGGMVEEFRIKAGPSSGNYTRTTVIPDPNARTLDILTAIGNTGTWFVIATAANTAGESDPSNEISFDAFYIRDLADAAGFGEAIGSRTGQAVKERLQIRRRLTP